MFLPDYLIPLPLSFWQKQRHGFDVNLTLATEVSKIFSVPIQSALKRKFDRSHFLTQGDVRFHFQLAAKNKEPLCDKRLLLIAPMLDDALLRLAGNELRACFPMQLGALAFATE